MSKAFAIYKVHSTNSLPHLTLDDMLVTQGLTHQKYRNWLKDNDKPLYKLTPNMCEEVEACSDTTSRHELSKQFHIDALEVNYCLYTNKPGTRGIDPMKQDRAAALRASGSTELDIIALDLPPNMAKLSLEITARRKNGESIASLSALYGYSIGRISQLDQQSTKKPRLSKETKAAIKADTTQTAAALAKKYNTTVNTIYIIRREK